MQLYLKGAKERTEIIVKWVCTQEVCLLCVELDVDGEDGRLVVESLHLFFR